MSLPGKEEIIEVNPAKIPIVEPEREIQVEPLFPDGDPAPAPEPVEPEKVPAA